MEGMSAAVVCQQPQRELMAVMSPPLDEISDGETWEVKDLQSDGCR